MKRSAFTMIELIFVIVILGILASIATTKLIATRDDAVFTKGKADISAIRSSIATTRSIDIMQGNPNFPATLTDPLRDGLFNEVLDYPVKAAVGGGSGWAQGADDVYFFTVDGTTVEFQYDNTSGIFTCVNFNAANSAEDKLCTKLAQ
ncbi:MAG: type II secretion system GspH family protein [Campylobacteraceae bacterium]|jgi:general secretion pathway protein G|nr:type II secretion system GspH family protein [Campylobacteraceae bacterium]